MVCHINISIAVTVVEMLLILAYRIRTLHVEYNDFFTLYIDYLWINICTWYEQFRVIRSIDYGLLHILRL